MSEKCLQGMLTIETFPEPGLSPVFNLSQNDIRQLNLQISKELLAIIPGLENSSYAIVAGLYQSSQLLQPGFPVHSQLRQYAHAALKGENNKNNQLVIGAADNQLPEGLDVDKNIHQTPLLYIPFIIMTENPDTIEIFEQQLMHKGMGSRDLLIQLQKVLHRKIRHINFMTILDLAAMMHNHLQMAGFEPLWNLLEEALFNPQPETKVKLPQGNEFYLSKKIVFTPFFTYHFWKNNGPGLSIDNPQESYLQYTQLHRQYIATLQEHGLDVRQFIANENNWPLSEEHICFATLDQYRLTDDYHHEIIKALSTHSEADIRKHEHRHLGVLFFQLEDEFNGLECYYPMNPDGVNKVTSLLGLA